MKLEAIKADDLFPSREQDVDSEPGDSDSLELLSVGDYVEIRYGSLAEDAFVIAIEPSRDVVAITGAGEVSMVPRRKCAIRIPGVVGTEIARQAALSLEDDTREQAISGRVELVKAMRLFRKELERTNYAVRRVAMEFLYSHFRASDPSEWGVVTVSQARDFITQRLGKEASNFSPSIVKLVMHKFLLDQAEHFSISPTIPDQFHVVPVSYVHETREINGWMASRDPRIDAFIEKCRDIITFAKSLPSQPRNGNEIQAIPHPYITFNEDDQKIITFICHSLGRVRMTQANPFEPTLAEIGRRLGRTYGESTDWAHTLLTDIGVTPHWGPMLLENPLVSRWTDHSEEHLAVEGVKMLEQRASLVDHTNSLPRFGDGVDTVRHDWGDMEVYVIDDDGAQELDDGVSVDPEPGPLGSRWVHVHVADPTALLQPDDELAQVARRRGATLYLPSRSFSMFPDSFTSMFSLGNSPVQPVFTFSVQISADGSIIDYAARPGFVRNVCKLRYDQVDQALGHPTPEMDVIEPLKPRKVIPQYPPLSSRAVDNLKLLNEVARLLVRRRIHDQGYFLSPFAKFESIVQQSPLPTASIPPHRPVHYIGEPSVKLVYPMSGEYNYTSSRHTVAEFMIMTSRVAAKLAMKRNIPILYRVHEVKNLHEVLGPLRDPETGAVPHTLQTRQLHTVTGISTTPGGHDLLGLGGDPYTRATSPLRRFMDVVCHWQLKSSLGNFPPPFNTEQLKVLADELFNSEKEMRRLGSMEGDYWVLRHFKRVFEGSESKEHFRELEAIVVSEPRGDLRHASRLWRRNVYVPKLLAKGTIVDMTREEAFKAERGMTVKVDVKGILPGPVPALELELSRQ
ncbi:hypothetical protein FRB99_001814 [Tulasnella sp. 403]|nr:hypothetical protein FRB99_001814 [Tulasnella sp. 403]